MKGKSFFNSDFLINILCIISLILLVFVTGKDFYTSRQYAISGSYENNLKPIDIEIPNTTPHESYQHLTDSIKHARFLKTGRGYGSGTHNFFGGAVHTRFYTDKELKNKRFVEVSAENIPDSYFITVPGWTLDKKDERQNMFGDNTYYVENGIPYFRKYVVKSHDSKHATYVMTEDRLKYYYDDDYDTLLIPVTKPVYQFFKYFFMSLAILIGVILIGCMFYMIKLLYRISWGKVFVPQNLQTLKITGLTCLIIPIISMVISLVYRLIFWQYLDDNIIFNMKAFKANVILLLVGLVVVVLYKAFKRGYDIQSENDLVV